MVPYRMCEGHRLISAMPATEAALPMVRYAMRPTSTTEIMLHTRFAYSAFCTLAPKTRNTGSSTSIG